MADGEKYTIELSAQAEAAFKKLDKPVAQRIASKLKWLAENVEDHPHTALKGEWKGLYRYRIGDYRAIYRLEKEDNVLVVERLGHRREIYDD